MTHAQPSPLGRRAVAAIAITAVAIAAALMTSATRAQAQTITQSANTLPLYGFGKPSVATVGQTFLAPTTGTLTGFSFWLSNEAGLPANNTPDAEQLTFRAYVMRWDLATMRTVGPVLFSSPVRSGPTQLSQEYQFATPALAVTMNARYIAFLSASGLFGSIIGDPSAALLLSDGAATNGSLVFLDNGDDVSLFGSTAWQDGTDASAPQAQFRATFVTTVPEPSSVVLVGVAMMGLAMIAAARARRA